MKLQKLSGEWLLIGGLVLLKLLLHFLTNTNYELHRDAFLYLAEGDHLDFGYLSVPPSIAVFARLTTSIFGDSVFAVRLFPALLGAASIILVALIVKELGGKSWAIVLSGCAFIVSPAFLRSNTLFQPVSFDEFYWLLAGYFMVKLLKTGHPKFWIHLGIVFGLGFLNKYSIAVLAFAFALSLSLTPARKLFRSKYLLLGAGSGFLLIFPNLIWQWSHRWPVVGHLAELRENQLVHVTIPDFLLAQLWMNFPAIPVWGCGLLFLLFHKEGKPYRSLGYTVLAVALILLLLRGKPYYTLGIYPLLFAAGGFALETWLHKRWRFLKWAALGMMILLALPALPYSLPVLPYDKMRVYAEQSKRYGMEGALRWEDGRIHPLPQDYADMIGWEELGKLAADAYHRLSAEERERCAIYAENYGQAGAIKYHGRKYGLPEPVSFDDNFLLWAPDSLENLLAFIYVNDEFGEDIQHFFAEVTLAGQLSNPYAREYGLGVYLCKHPKPELGEFYSEKVRQLKQRFQRE